MLSVAVQKKMLPQHHFNCLFEGNLGLHLSSMVACYMQFAQEQEFFPQAALVS